MSTTTTESPAPQTATPETPAGMVRVTKEEFFASIGPRDVHPSDMNPNFTNWETPYRVVIGRSFPGWRNPGDPSAYFLVK